MGRNNVIVCGIVAAFVIVGIYDVLTNFESNRCAMSYMWETPEYIPVPRVNQTVQDKYPQYALTLYGEGKYAKEIKNMKLTGVPVLFIPGNAGSHKQVRSLSSIALRKSAKYNFHFNYFSVDLNEELNGMYGGVLEGQTEYVQACVERILELYSGRKNPPKQLVIIGHSKGGLVAKALFSRPNFDASQVNSLITMGTPHAAPVIKADAYIDQFTARVDKYWAENIESPAMRDLTVVSIGGSYRDNMVRSGLTSINGMVPPDRGLSVVVGSVPRVWLSTDHRCIVWCKELVLATDRALFDLVDRLTRQVSVNPDYRMKVFRHHFVAHDGRNSYSPHTEDVVGFADENFKAITTGFQHIAGRHNQGPVYYTFPLDAEGSDQDAFAIAATVASEKAWLFVCTRSYEERCIKGVDISRRAKLMPPLKSNMRLAHLDLADLGIAGPKQIVVRVPKSNKIHVIVDAYKKSERVMSASLPGFFSYKPKTIMKQHDSHSLFFNISLPELDSVWKAYTAILEPAHCFEPVRRDGNTTLHLHVPWFQEDEWSVAKATENNVMSLKLQSGRPAGDERPVQLHAYVYSRCHYRLRVAISHREIPGQMMRFYGTLLPGFVVVVALLAVSFLLRNIDAKKKLEVYTDILSTHCKPYMVAPFVALVKALLPRILPDLAAAHDFNILDRQGINFGLLPILFFVLGYGILSILGGLLEMDVQILGRFFSLFKGTSIALDSDQSAGSLGYSLLLYAILGGLSGVCLGASSTLVLIILTVLYLLKVIALQARAHLLKTCLNLSQSTSEQDKDSQQEKEQTAETDAKSQENGSTPSDKEAAPPTPLDVANTSLSFHFSVMILLLLLTLLNVPSLAVWVKNMRREVYNLDRDPALYPTLVVLAALSVLLDPAYTVPKKGPLTKAIALTVHVFCVAALLFGMDTMYRLSYYIAATVLLVAVNQVFSS
ncbi:GPI inositol-deacylase-like [Diadema antillarum]|uniref:GPI inositol-deacylase-like n=1 Tax=Diadema antillarum TaxID=105358 RepID=UPI003A89A3A0